MPRAFAVRDADAVERMDDPGCDPVRLARTYARFGLVNAVVAAPRATYRRWIAPRLRSGDVRLLDIGTGGGDFPRAVLRWARGSAGRVDALAVDPDPRAFAFASRGARARGLRIRQMDTAAVLATGERFDVVVSNHVLHHLSDGEAVQLLDESARLLRPGGVAVHRDIARSRAAHAAFAVGTLPFQPFLLRDTFIREDGLASIRRSRTAAELSAIVPDGWRVRRGWPARVEAVLGG
ncbi:methyltransferase domain-containing protein [Microbacterium betulae]|uniref:Methyltransferase domain-containing protein n=1 Tax=Microbacterium betulae TaxID=2981139 RepID=A0AA97FJC2_9MICO|nr:methyltransferase domain-containing protein [Microbacterium sp. AB]WOF22597.1 methyltransferase domain-containing protein [Microbacterium sp. AB]